MIVWVATEKIENKEPVLPFFSYLLLWEKVVSAEEQAVFNLFSINLLQIFYKIFFWHAYENFPPFSAKATFPTISCLSSANHKGEVQLWKYVAVRGIYLLTLSISLSSTLIQDKVSIVVKPASIFPIN
jgi:hypothetical protein